MMHPVRCLLKFRQFTKTSSLHLLQKPQIAKTPSLGGKFVRSFALKGSDLEKDPKNRFPDDTFVNTQSDGFTDPEKDPMGPPVDRLEWAFENPDYPGADPKLREFVDAAAAEPNERWANMLRGLPLRGDFGTEEEPVLVPSEMPFRVVGCTGNRKETPPHDLLWFTIRAGPIHRCPECGQCFRLDTTWAGHFEHPAHEEWKAGGGENRDPRQAPEFTAQGISGHASHDH